MTPLGAVVAGLLLVLLDLRIGGVDLLADVVGWVLAISGLSRLRRVDRVFSGVRASALPTLVLSLADLVHPQGTGPSDGLQGLLISAYQVAMVVVAVLLCLALRDRARRHGDQPLAERFSLFAVLQVVATVLVLLLVGLVALTSGAPFVQAPGEAAALTIGVVVAVVALEVWFLATLAGARRRPWLQEVSPRSEDPAAHV